MVLKETDLEPAAKSLKLDNTVTEFAAGSVAARIMVGFGAGTPHLRLRGQIADMTTGKPLLIYDIDEREGEVMGHMTSTGLLQESLAANLVKDISDLLVQIAKHQPIRYK